MYLYSRKDFLILGENGGNGDSGLVFNIVFPDKTVKTIVLEKDKYYLESILKDETLKLQEEYYQKLIDYNLLYEDDKILKLTDKGLLLGNIVFEEFL